MKIISILFALFTVVCFADKFATDAEDKDKDIKQHEHGEQDEQGQEGQGAHEGENGTHPQQPPTPPPGYDEHFVQELKFLTKENWDKETENKNVFVSFCGREKCMAIKDVIQKVMKNFDSLTYIMFVVVDCAGDGKSLCEDQGITTTPAIKMGNPLDLDKYAKKSYSRDDMDDAAEEHLTAKCSIQFPWACSEAQLALKDKYMGMTVSEIKTKLESMDEEIRAREQKIAAMEIEHYKDYESTHQKIAVEIGIARRDRAIHLAKAMAGKLRNKAHSEL